MLVFGVIISLLVARFAYNKIHVTLVILASLFEFTYLFYYSYCNKRLVRTSLQWTANTTQLWVVIMYVVFLTDAENASYKEAKMYASIAEFALLFLSFLISTYCWCLCIEEEEMSFIQKKPVQTSSTVQLTTGMLISKFFFGVTVLFQEFCKKEQTNTSSVGAASSVSTASNAGESNPLLRNEATQQEIKISSVVESGSVLEIGGARDLEAQRAVATRHNAGTHELTNEQIEHLENVKQGGKLVCYGVKQCFVIGMALVSMYFFTEGRSAEANAQKCKRLPGEPVPPRNNTNSPSSLPSVVLTNPPSFAPTKSPSFVSTNSPSFTPSNSPFFAFTNSPSFTPTNLPSHLKEPRPPICIYSPSPAPTLCDYKKFHMNFMFGLNTAFFAISTMLIITLFLKGATCWSWIIYLSCNKCGPTPDASPALAIVFVFAVLLLWILAWCLWYKAINVD